MNISGGVLKFLALLLAFVLGFLACAGALFFGGRYIYKNVSYETLQSWGVPLPSTEALLDTHADVRLTSLTLAQLVAEMQSLSSYGDRLTLELLVDRYGVKLPSGIDTLLPNALMEVSLTTLFSAEGVNYLLTNTTAEYLFQFLPADTLSEPARAALQDTKLSELMGGDIGTILADVKLGYFLDVTYELQDDGSYTLKYADPDHPTTNELIAPLSLGALIDATANDGDVLKVVKDDIGDCSLKLLLGESTDGTWDPFVKEKTLGELIVYDSATGKHALKAEKLTDGVLLGDIMGYEAVKDEAGKTTWWQDDEQVNALESAMADVTLEKFMSSSFELTDVVEDLYLGDVMGYEQNENSEWCEKDENETLIPLTGMDKAIAGVLLGDVLDGDDDAITNAFADLYFGEIMGYEQGKSITDENGKVSYVWYEKKMDENGERVELTGIDKAVANILLDDLLNNDDYEITDAFADLYLGEAMGYEQGDPLPKADGADEDAVDEYEWLEDGKNVSGIKQKFSNYLLGDVLDGTADISADDMYLYEVMDLYKKEYPAYAEDGTELTTYTVWYENEACTKRAADVFSALAEVSVADMKTELPKMLIGATVGMVAVADDEENDKWYDVSEIREHTVGGKTEEYVVLTPADGIMTSFAGLSIDDMSDDETVRGAVNDITLAEALGYTEGKNGKYYDADVTDESKYTYTEGAYYVNGATEPVDPVSGIMAVLAPKEVGDMSSEVDKIYLGEVMGWHYDENDDPTQSSSWKDENDEEPTGIMSYFAKLTVKQMSNEKDVHDVVQDIKLSDALGYTEGENGKYYTVDVTDGSKYTYDEDEEAYYANGATKPTAPVSGIMAVLAPKNVGNLELEIDKMYLGEVMGWTLLGYEEDPDDPENPKSRWEDENGDPAGGFMLAFAGLTVNQMSDEGAVHDVVKTLTLAEAMNYTEKDGVYYDENEQKITGVLATLVDAKIGDMQTEVENTYVGEMMGWVPEWINEDDHHRGVKEWYYDVQKTQVARGLAKPFASMTLSEMSDDDKVEKKVESIYVYEVMGYYKGENGLYYEKDYKITDEKLYEYQESEGAYYALVTMEDPSIAAGDRVPPVDGIMAALAETQISGLDARVTDLKVKDIFSSKDLNSGFLSLIDPDTYLYAGEGKTGLADEVSNTVATAPIGQFLKRKGEDDSGDEYVILEDVTLSDGRTVSPTTAELIVLDKATCEILNDLDLAEGKPEGAYYTAEGKGPYARYWQKLTINELLDYIVQSLGQNLVSNSGSN